MSVTMIRRAHGNKPGDEVVELVYDSAPVPLELHGVPVESWTQPSKRVPRKREPVVERALGVVLAVVFGAFMAMAFVHWASWPNT